jgi:hypothetical protein
VHFALETCAMIARIAEWLGLAGLYLFFAGQPSTPEITVALLAAAGVTLYRARLLRRARAFRVEPRLWLAAVPGLSGALMRDAALVGAALLRALGGGEMSHGRFMQAPLADRPADPVARGRRAFAILAGSLAPNSYVVALSRPEARITMHRLAGAGPEEP